MIDPLQLELRGEHRKRYEEVRRRRIASEMASLKPAEAEPQPDDSWDEWDEPQPNQADFCDEWDEPAINEAVAVVCDRRMLQGDLY